MESLPRFLCVLTGLLLLNGLALVHVDLPRSSSDTARQQHLGPFPSDDDWHSSAAELDDASGNHRGGQPLAECRHQCWPPESLSQHPPDWISVHTANGPQSCMHAVKRERRVPGVLQLLTRCELTWSAARMRSGSRAPGAERGKGAPDAGVLAGARRGAHAAVAGGELPAHGRAEPRPRLFAHPWRLQGKLYPAQSHIHTCTGGTLFL